MTLLALIASIGLACFPGEVRVQVRNATGAPVANAEVRWFAEPALRFDFERMDELALASGNVGRSDETGQLVLDVATAVTVVGSAPKLWGCGSTESDVGEFELTLVEDRDLVAIAVDESGQPVGGVPVTVLLERRHYSSDTNWRETFWTEPVWGATSDASTGRAVWRHASHALIDLRRSVDGASQYLLIGEDVMPFFGGGVLPIEESIPLEPLELLVRESFDVELRVMEGSSTPAVGRVRLEEKPWIGEIDSSVSLDRTGDDREMFGAAHDSSRPLSSSGAGWQKGLLIAGNTRLRALVPDRDLELHFQRNAASLPIRFPFRVSPKSSEPAVVEVNLDSAPGLRTILLRPTVDGRAIGAGSVTVQRFDPEQRGGVMHSFSGPDIPRIEIARHRVELDASGRLVVDVGLNLHLTSEVCVGWSDDRGEREAWIDLRVLAVGRHDFGDVELEPSVVALAGVLLDDAGRPIQGARLESQLYVKHAFSIPVAADGSFELRSNRNVATDLLATAPGYFSEFLPAIPHGTTGLRIVLSRRVDVSGSLVLGPLASLEGLSILLLRVAEGESIDTAPGFSRSCRCGGPFEFEDVRPGRYTLIVRRAGERGRPIELLRRDGIQIPPVDAFDLGQIRID